MKKETGLIHFFKAAGYSWKGLKSAFKYEVAFRHELLASIIMIPFAIWFAHSAIELVLLIGSVLLVLSVELLNSGLEAIVDRVGKEYHELSGRAKDLGSAAVFMAMCQCGLTWLILILARFW